ncbi:MAG: LicD family protein [Anaeroplasmataceae bacterium]|nr:LicD family protein [Anaeroplasmataceae bacterium]
MNLNEEVICGFTVTEGRKRVWQKEIEMVQIFIHICKKHHLKYFAASGTLIGAIRHQGFIPWDDDIDIMMPREDYERFLQVAKEELQDPFFLQHYSTEKNYPNGHIQIRNSQTTCFIHESYVDLKNGKNCGIFIDIFPFDKVFDNYKKRQKYCKKIKVLKALAMWRVYGTPSFLRRMIVKFYFCFHSLQKTIIKIDKLSKNLPNKDKQSLVSIPTFLPGYEKEVWDEKWFDKMVDHKFEDIEMAIPEKYDEVLRKEYGDYFVIPEDKGGAMHGQCYFDCDTPFEQYKDITKEEFEQLFVSFIL